MTHSILRPALVLGLISALGPFTIDMYLPAIPAIGAALGTDASGMQATLSFYFLAFGLAQLIYGPWADRAGRKLPLFAGMALFALGTVLCMAAPTIGWLIAGRVIQGLGAAALGVVPRAIIRDTMTGNDATRLMAAMMLVFSVSPMLAPLVGSGLLLFTGWRGIFGALLVAAAVSATLLALLQPETLAPENRRPLAPALLARGMIGLFADKSFLLLTLIAAFGVGSFLIYISGAPYVFAQSFGLTPAQFSLGFATSAIFFFGGSQLAAPLGKRLGPRPVLIGAALWFCALSLGMAGLALAGQVGLVTMVLGTGLANVGLGMIFPTTMVLALEDQGQKAGLASSLGGTLQMAVGAAMGALVGPWLDGTPAPMLTGMALCGVVVLGLTLWAMSGYAAARASS